MKKKVEKIYDLYEHLKKCHCYISDNERLFDERVRDMSFGKIIAMEMVIKILEEKD